MESFLKKISEPFKKFDYQFFIGGPESFLFYLRNSKKVGELEVFSNCDLVFLAKNFDGVRYSEDGYSAVVEVLNIKLNFNILPDINLKVIENLKRKFSQNRFNIELFFYLPSENKFFDPFGVLKSLKEKSLFLIDRTNIKLEDILRGIYIASEYGFVFNENFSLKNREFSKVELNYFFKILTSKNPFYGLSLLDRFSILKLFIPEIETLKGCPQDKEFHPEGDVFTHTLECFKKFRTENRVLAFSLLLHDIGKPETISHTPSLKFPYHAIVGAKIAKKISKRLGFTKDEIDELTFYIKNHLLGAIVRGAPEYHVLEIVNSPYVNNLLKLYKADILGSMGDLREYKKVVKSFEEIKKEHIFF